jgi:hypothetical protein
MWNLRRTTGIGFRVPFAWLVLVPTLAVGGQLSISPAVLQTLPESGQLQVLCDALRKRAEILSNVYCNVHVENFVVLDAGQELGDRVETISRYDQEFWKLGDAYRLKHSGYVGLEQRPLFVSDSSFDPKKGLARMLGKHSQSEVWQGRISTQHDNITKFNEYAKFLPGYLHGTQPSHLQYVLDNFEKAQVVGGAPHGTIAIQFCKALTSGLADVRTYWFVPEKDFMILRSERRRSWGNGTQFQCVDIRVTSELEVDSLWVPEVVVATGWSERTESGRRGVTKFSIEGLDISHVKESDLWVEFPEGAEVIDDFTQNVYVVGDPDTPIARVDTDARSEENTLIEDIPWVIVLDVVFVVGLFLLFNIRQRRARMRSALDYTEFGKPGALTMRLGNGEPPIA